MSASDIRIVLVTVPNEQSALHIAHALVERNLAACCNIISHVRSVYRWQGTVQDDAELLLIIKTRAEAYSNLEAAVLELHPYDTPEIIGLAPEHCAEKYLSWVLSETSTTN